MCLEAWRKHEMEEIAKTLQVISKLSVYESRYKISLRKMDVNHHFKHPFTVVFTAGGKELKRLNIQQNSHQGNKEDQFEGSLTFKAETMSISVYKKGLLDTLISSFEVKLLDLSLQKEQELLSDKISMWVEVEFQQVVRNYSSSVDLQKLSLFNFHSLFSEIVHTIVIPPDFLEISPEMVWLLNEMRVRFGISELYSNLRHFFELIKSFSNQKEYLSVLKSNLDRLQKNLVEYEIAKVKKTNAERDLYQQAAERLKKLLERNLKSYVSTFSRKESFDALRLNLQIYSQLTDEDPARLARVLAPLVETAVAKNYCQFKVRLEEEKIGGAEAPKKLSQFLMLMVKQDKDLFSPEFPPQLCLPRLTAAKYWSLLLEDVREYLSGVTEVTSQAFELFGFLNKVKEFITHEFPDEADQIFKEQSLKSLWKVSSSITIHTNF